ncbi:MAG: ABC transporter permease, partial [Candidatus Odinarchaeota archaeon]|nr:ABC transporter permease [Candidatus Odinarchaeota archaeon]
MSSLVQMTLRTFKKDWKRVAVAILVVAFSVSFLTAIVVATDSALPTIYKDLTFSGVEDIKVTFINQLEGPSITNITKLFEKENQNNILSKFDYYSRLGLQFKTMYKGSDIISLLYTINSTRDPLYANLILDEGSFLHNFNTNECIVSRALAQKYNLKIDDKLNISIREISEKNITLTIVGIGHLRGVEYVYPLSKHYGEFILTGHLTISKINPEVRNKAGCLGIYLKKEYLTDYQTYQETVNDVYNWVTKILIDTPYGGFVERLKTYALKLYFPRIEEYKNRFLFITSFVLIGTVVAIVTTQLIRYHKALYQIGLLKAVGFRNKEIEKLFLYEAFFIGVFGSLLGIGLGVLFNPIIRNFLVETSLSKIMFRELLYDPLKSTNYTTAIV